jgi:hypothetical protein
MKNLIVALIIFLPTLAGAQDAFITEEMVTTKEMTVDAFVIGIKGDFDDAVDNYKNFVKEGFEYKVDKVNKTTYMVEAVDLPHLSLKRGDLKTYLITTDSMNVMAFSFFLGYDVFLTSKENPQEMTQFRKFVIDFMDFHYKAFYTVEIEKQTKDLEGSKKELLQNENKVSSLKKKVVSLAKKKDKEEDATKKVDIDSQKQLTENEITVLVDEATALRGVISKKEKALYKQKQELNKYHLQITSL